jgi:hypothetical protein
MRSVLSLAASLLDGLGSGGHEVRVTVRVSLR